MCTRRTDRRTAGWTAGAIGLMTLAVMTPMSLGHTGQAITATRPIQAICVTVVISALARIVAAFPLWREPMLRLITHPDRGAARA